jgi:Mg2+ and Co2+ transporter CorA
MKVLELADALLDKFFDLLEKIANAIDEFYRRIGLVR